jgi:hypothetical protein
MWEIRLPLWALVAVAEAVHAHVASAQTPDIEPNDTPDIPSGIPAQAPVIPSQRP